MRFEFFQEEKVEIQDKNLIFHFPIKRDRDDAESRFYTILPSSDGWPLESRLSKFLKILTNPT